MNKKIIKKFTKPILIAGCKAFMWFQKYHTHILEINNKHLKPCIYVMWHHNQFCVYGIPDKSNLYVLVSKSFDGDIVNKGVEMLGFKTVRGSANKKGAIECSMQMIEHLQEGKSVAIMVDGPAGPYHKVKNGAIKIAQMTGAPIVPVVWYSDQWNWVQLPSWDKIECPLAGTKLVNLYGEPIYVPKELSKEDIEEYKAKIKSSLDELTKRIPEEFKKAKKNNMWKNLKTIR